jgi:[ribosomal protein S5]-alanine N-acetyltransferase
MKTASEKIVIDQKGRIFLRELSVDEVTPAYLSWMNDQEVTQYLESRFYPQTIDSIREFVEGCAKDPDTLFLAVRDSGMGKHIGNIKLHRINRTHKTAEMSIMIGDKSFWGKGIAAEAITLLSDYAFKMLGLHKLTAECYATNMGSRKAFEKAGYVLEGTRREQYICDGRPVDSYILGKTPQ